MKIERIPISREMILFINKLGCDKSTFLIRMRRFFLTSDTFNI